MQMEVEQYERLLENYKMLPVYKVYDNDLLTPIGILKD